MAHPKARLFEFADFTNCRAGFSHFCDLSIHRPSTTNSGVSVIGIFDIFTTDAQDAAAASQKAGLNAGYSQASDLLGQGRDALKTNYSAALQPLNTAFNQSTTTGAQGYQALADASGANGPEGLARAKTNFTATPGYTEGLNLSLDQNDRRAASRGMLASGNTDQATTQLATDYANQKYGSYVAGLQPYANNPMQSAAIGGQIAGVNTGLGTALNSSLGQQASSAYGTQTGIGNANANADLANLTASQNIWGAAMQGAKMLMGSGGGSGGGGGSSGSSFMPSASFLQNGMSWG